MGMGQSKEDPSAPAKQALAEMQQKITANRQAAAQEGLASLLQDSGMGIGNYQYGGTVPGYPGQPQPAIVHGGEQILPNQAMNPNMSFRPGRGFPGGPPLRETPAPGWRPIMGPGGWGTTAPPGRIPPGRIGLPSPWRRGPYLPGQLGGRRGRHRFPRRGPYLPPKQRLAPPLATPGRRAMLGTTKRRPEWYKSQFGG